MIDWETIRPAFQELFAELADLSQAEWRDKRRPFASPRDQAWVLLHVVNERSVGIDDRRYRDTGETIPDYPCRESANGNRVVRLEVRVESFRHDDDRFAYNAASKVRTRLGWQSSADTLRALNVSVATKGETVDVSNLIQDDRITSVALFDLLLNFGVSEEDAAHPVPAIETVEDPVGTFN